MTARGKKIIKILAIVFGSIGALIGIIAIAVSLQGSKVQTLTIGGVSKELNLGNINYSTVEMSLSVYPETAENEPITVYSENADVARVERVNGVVRVYAVSEGVTNIVAVVNKDTKIFDKCEIVVKDIAVELITFYEEGDEEYTNNITSYNVKRDGSIYSIPFLTYPIDANLDNIEPYFDTNVFSSVKINQEKRTLDIQAIEDAEANSSLLNLYLKQNTTEGIKRVGTTILQIFIEPKTVEMTFGFRGDPTLETGYNKNHNNNLYLDKSKPVAEGSGVWVQIYHKTRLSEGVDRDEVFNTQNYFYEIFNNDGEDGNKVVIENTNKDYFIIKAQNLEYGDTVMVTFTHKQTNQSIDLTVTGAQCNPPKSPADTQNIGLGTIQSAVINGITYSGDDTYKIDLREVVSWEFNGENNGIVEVSEINGVIYVKGLAIGEQTITFTTNNTYWDSRFFGEAESGVRIKFVIEKP